MTTPISDGTEGATPSSGGESTAEPQTTANGEAGNGEDAEGGTPVSRADLAKELDKWKALSRKNELRAKENSAAAKKLADFENANKSELQKAQDAAAQAQEEVALSRAEKYRLLAAAAHGLGQDFSDYLGSGEEAEIFERAETLAGKIQAQVDAQIKAELSKYGLVPNGQNGTAPTAAAAASLSLGRRPVESLRPGSAPANDGVPASKNDAFRQMLGR